MGSPAKKKGKGEENGAKIGMFIGTFIGKTIDSAARGLKALDEPPKKEKKD